MFALIDLSGIAFCVLMVILSVRLTIFVAGTGQISPTLGIPAYVIYVAPIVGFASLAFGFVLRLFSIRDARTKTAVGRMARRGAAAMIWLILVATTVMMFLGFEMFLVLGIPSWLIQQAYYGNMPSVVLVQKMIAGIDNSVLLAIPFFIFAAELMSEGRIAELLSRTTNACFRRLRGGAAYGSIGVLHGVRLGLRFGAGDGRGARPADVSIAADRRLQRGLQPWADRLGRRDRAADSAEHHARSSTAGSPRRRSAACSPADWWSASCWASLSASSF